MQKRARCRYSGMHASLRYLRPVDDHLVDGPRGDLLDVVVPRIYAVVRGAPKIINGASVGETRPPLALAHAAHPPHESQFIRRQSTSYIYTPTPNSIRRDRTTSGVVASSHERHARDLQGNNDDGAEAVTTFDLSNAIVNINEDGVVVIEFDNGYIVKCNDDGANLSESDMLHCKIAMEQDGNDADGMQGGQEWSPPTQRPTTRYPTERPTRSPTTTSPTIYTTASREPTDGPTPRGDPFVLRGIIWYDRNANGRRDTNVDDPELGNDVETNVGLGGVQVRLMECDPVTNEALDMNENYDEGDNSYVATISRGYNALMHAMLVNRAEDGGK
jgi:hypothetical protein